MSSQTPSLYYVLLQNAARLFPGDQNVIPAAMYTGNTAKRLRTREPRAGTTGMRSRLFPQEISILFGKEIHV
jgi:hypothetical protein